MAYLHIDNLYKNQSVLHGEECYAMEKIHGTSAHISWKTGELRFFSGGEKHENFVAFFDVPALTERFREVVEDMDVIVYGEAYGGKCQGMSKTYGPKLRFVAFDVKFGNVWMTVPEAGSLCAMLGLEFVHYVRCSTSVAVLDTERDKPSTQAVRNGIEEPRITEGIVIRPINEGTDIHGDRIIAKHKRAEFRERKSIPEVDPAKRELLANANAIAEEWVTPMRLTHVLDKMGNPTTFEQIPAVIAAMFEDVTREAAGEIVIVDNAAVRKAIGSATVKLYKQRCSVIGS